MSPVYLCVCAAAFAAVTADSVLAQGTAQARRQQDRAPMRFAALDRNGDGVITRAEWNGNDRSFQNNDWNGDGILSGDEVRPGARRAMRQQQQGNVPDRAAREEDFAALDFNRDGIVTQEEWFYESDRFRRIDRNRDNIVTRTEFLNESAADQPVGTSGDSFVTLDDDRDGRISVNEWQGTPERFEVLDDNRDGYLSRREVAGELAADMFESLDQNNDGSVARGEWRRTRAEFDRLDTNRDGRLTRSEMARNAAAPTESAAYRAGYNRGLIDGRQAGREDFQSDRMWDLEGQRELEQADAGYDSTMGVRADYQAGYREGFRRGYPDGFMPR